MNLFSTNFIFIQILFLFVQSFIFTEGFASDKTSFVNGRVVDERNFPVANIKVLIGPVETITDQFGNFKFGNISYPYEVTIAEQYTSTAVIYKNLSLENPDLVLFGDNVFNNSTTVYLNISFKDVPDGSNAIIKFISPDVSESKEIVVNSKANTAVLSVSWPLYQNSIRGQLVYLERNNSGYQTIKLKDVTIYKSNSAINFKFSSRPGKKIKTSILTIYSPGDYNEKKLSVFAGFLNYDKSSEFNLIRIDSTPVRSSIIVPDDLPGIFKLKITGYGRNKNGSGVINYTYVSPGAEVKIPNEFVPELQLPVNNYLSANGNTEFSYTSGSGAGVYVLEFKSNNPVINFYVVTDEKFAKLNYLSRNEFRTQSVEFSWSVRKYLTYFSVTEFVKPSAFKNDFAYKAVLFSDKRIFKTGYF